MESFEGNGIGNNGTDPLKEKPTSLGATFRVVNPVREPQMAVNPNGLKQEPVRKGYKTVSHVIGSFLPEKEARELAAQLNYQKPFVDKVFRPARIVKEKI